MQRDPARSITKFVVVDRYSGKGDVARMFWRGCGPRDPDTSPACSVAHDHHNVWVVGSSDATMARAVNEIAVQGGGRVLVRGADVTARVRFEIAGLMTARPAESLDREMQTLYAAAREIEWMYETTTQAEFRPALHGMVAEHQHRQARHPGWPATGVSTYPRSP